MKKFKKNLSIMKYNEEVLNEKAVKKSTQILYDKGLFDIYDNADEVLKDYLFIDGAKERPRPNIEELNDGDNVIQCF